MPTILTEEQARERLNSSNNLVSRFGKVPSSVIEVENKVTIIPLERPDRSGAAGLPENIKNEIATRARLGERQIDLAREFGISQPNVSYLKNGITPVDEVAVEGRINEVRDVALNKLMASLGFIDDNKLKGLKATELSSIASNMSKVVSNTIMKDKEATAVHLHLYAPELRTEASFQTVEVR